MRDEGEREWRRRMRDGVIQRGKERMHLKHRRGWDDACKNEFCQSGLPIKTQMHCQQSSLMMKDSLFSVTMLE